jgi:hypothetical protein
LDFAAVVLVVVGLYEGAQEMDINYTDFNSKGESSMQIMFVIIIQGCEAATHTFAI